MRGRGEVWEAVLTASLYYVTAAAYSPRRGSASFK